MRIRKAVTFALLFTLSFLPSALSRDEVRDSERLRLLNQATGQTPAGSSTSSFETRVNSLFDVGSQSNPTQSYSMRQDEIEFMKEKQRLDTALQEQTGLTKQKAPEATGNAFESRIPVYKDDKRELQGVDASEESFQRDVQERYEKEKAAEAQRPSRSAPRQAASSASSVSTLPPSLANNPFYKGGGYTGSDNGFDAQKPVILTRMLQAGYTREEAEAFLSDASSPEDLVLDMMATGTEYGEAVELSKTS